MVSNTNNFIHKILSYKMRHKRHKTNRFIIQWKKNTYDCKERKSMAVIKRTNAVKAQNKKTKTKN